MVAPANAVRWKSVPPKRRKSSRPFGRAVERHAHAVEHVDDARRRVGHALDGRLVGEEVAAVGRLFEVHLRGCRLRPWCSRDALMPPCAHTECERLTGTSEKRVDGDAWPRRA